MEEGGFAGVWASWEPRARGRRELGILRGARDRIKLSWENQLSPLEGGSNGEGRPLEAALSDPFQMLCGSAAFVGVEAVESGAALVNDCARAVVLESAVSQGSTVALTCFAVSVRTTPK